MKTGIYWQDPKYAVGQCRTDPSCVLYLPLHRLDGASFMSKDAYGHLCTVTGALWRPSGRYFDGLDDIINCGDSPCLRLTNDFTIEMWFRSEDLTQFQTYTIDKANDYALLYEYDNDQIYLFSLGYTGDNPKTGSQIEITDMAFHHIIYSYNGSVLEGDKDGVNIFSLPKTFTLPTSTGDLTINRIGNYCKAVIGEIRIYNRGLTFAERQHNYLATKWRYQ